MGKEIIVNNENFESEVMQSDKPVLVDFWAPWCGPCKMVGPTIEAIAEEYADKLKVCKCNVDDNAEIAQKYGIVSIPTLIVFNGGSPAKEDVGVKTKDEIEAMFADLV